MANRLGAQLARECEKRQALELKVKRLEKAISIGDGGSFVEAACLWREAVEARRTIYFSVACCTEVARTNRTAI